LTCTCDITSRKSRCIRNESNNNHVENVKVRHGDGKKVRKEDPSAPTQE
jgi:hypothetical protein